MEDEDSFLTSMSSSSLAPSFMLGAPPRLSNSLSLPLPLSLPLSLSASTSTTADRSRRIRSSRDPNSRHRRTKLSTEERAKVLEVRRQRACLRCKMLKIQCSKENPCKPCLSSAVRGYERKVLSFCYCVRTRFVDVDIFHTNESGPRPELPPSIRTLMDQIEPPVLPVLEENVFEDTLLRWLASTTEEYTPPTSGSVVAMLYALVGQSESLRRAVDVHLPGDFETFLFTTSLVHTGWDGPVSHRDLCVAGHVCGSRLVRRLDRVLTPQFLAKCDKEAHRALLLLIFGLVLGVSYSTRLTTSPSFPHDLLGLEMRHSPTLWLALKEHLCQMLAHHLIFLGSMLGIKLDTAAEKTIIESAVNRWHKPERCLWAGLAGDTLPMTSARAEHSARHADRDLALISRIFGLRGLEDFNDMDGLDLARPRQHSLMATAESPGTATATAPGPAGTPSLMPMVAILDSDLAGLQSIPLSEDTEQRSQYDHSHGHTHAHNQMLHDSILGNNPESYYTMSTDDMAGFLSPTGLDTYPSQNQNQGQHQNTEHSSGPSGGQTAPPLPPDQSPSPLGLDPPTTKKKRSVWIVRPCTDGSNREPVNVYARFRLQQGQNLGLFV